MFDAHTHLGTNAYNVEFYLLFNGFVDSYLCYGNHDGTDGTERTRYSIQNLDDTIVLTTQDQWIDETKSRKHK